ncbi:uncharacterized protein LOC109819572 [Asparagus officinalis]|uniref:uncharacterized protein LOC109819572 n=1 Tax=Asparagus officinalis TaxID=4686 RepID=UPI00098E7446|nr:uncharacterized protein LOC109819572 [Asparagus officinalis]
MESYVNKLWGNISIPKVSLIKQGLFLFDFQSEASMREILEAGPWFFGSRPLMLKPWSIDADIDKMQDFYYPMWAQFPNLRLNLWSSIGISKVASLIGKPIATDKLTANRERLSYARVLLEVKLPLKDPLPDQLNIQGPDGISYTQSVIYEYKPKWCSLCSKIGHVTEQCRRIKTKRMWILVIRQAEAPVLSKEPTVIPGLERDSVVQQIPEANISTEQIAGKNKETLSAGKHAQTEKHAQAESRIAGKGSLTFPANDSYLYSAPIVNASGFSSVNRTNLARRSSIGIAEFSGFNKSSKHKIVKQFIQEYDISLIGLLETKLHENKLKRIAMQITKDWKWTSNVHEARNGRIWILWDSDIFNVQDANNRIWSRLDRCLVNEDWIHQYTTSQVEFLLPRCSDHSPALLTIEDDAIKGKRPFKFFNMWVKHPEFIPTVKKVWEQNIEGYKMYSFHTKLKKLKLALKELNKKHFMNISEQVHRAKDELADTQRLLNGDPFSSDLINREKECIKKYDRLLECESSFYKQKANISWSLEGDKGSKFFHSIMKKKRHHNRILTLYNERGDRITDNEGIISEIVGYYNKLLGTSVPTSDPDPMVIANGPLLSHDQRQALSTPNYKR